MGRFSEMAQRARETRLENTKIEKPQENDSQTENDQSYIGNGSNGDGTTSQCQVSTDVHVTHNPSFDCDIHLIDVIRQCSTDIKIKKEQFWGEQEYGSIDWNRLNSLCGMYYHVNISGLTGGWLNDRFSYGDKNSISLSSIEQAISHKVVESQITNVVEICSKTYNIQCIDDVDWDKLTLLAQKLFNSSVKMYQMHVQGKTDKHRIISTIMQKRERCDCFTDDVFRSLLDEDVLFRICNNNTKNEEVLSDNPIEIAVNYYYGDNGYEEDNQLAFSYFNQALDQGDLSALFYLGDMYYYGYYVSSDKRKAFEFYKSSAENGYYAGMARLGKMYLFGKYVQTDDHKAYDWLQKANVGNNASAKFFLGYMYEYGYNVSENLSIALSFYKKAEELGDVLAKDAVRYRGYRNVPEDEKVNFYLE